MDRLDRIKTFYSMKVDQIFVRDPEALEGHIRPVAGIAWNPDGEQYGKHKICSLNKNHSSPTITFVEYYFFIFLSYQLR